MLELTVVRGILKAHRNREILRLCGSGMTAAVDRIDELMGQLMKASMLRMRMNDSGCRGGGGRRRAAVKVAVVMLEHVWLWIG